MKAFWVEKFLLKKNQYNRKTSGKKIAKSIEIKLIPSVLLSILTSKVYNFGNRIDLS